jgi:hypothetical protein
MRVAVICALVIGCTPSAEGVCEHVTRVVERSWPPDPKDSGAHDRAVAHCTTKWAQRKKDDPKAFKCYADCIDRVKYVVDLGSCESKCYPNMKLADEPEKLEGLIAFPDAAPSASASASASAK